MADRFDLDAIESDDALLDLLAAGGESARSAGERDPAVQLLADLRLAVEVEDELPVETIDDPESFLARCAAINPITDPFARKVATRGLALGVAAVAALSVSGVAAAVNGDPLSPYEKVIEKVVDAVRPQTSFPKEQLDGLPVLDKTKIVKVAKDYQDKARAGHLDQPDGPGNPGTDDPNARELPNPPQVVVPAQKPLAVLDKPTIGPPVPAKPVGDKTGDPATTDPGGNDQGGGDQGTDKPTDPPSTPTTPPPSEPTEPTTPTSTPTPTPTDPTTTTTPTTPPKGDTGTSDGGTPTGTPTGAPSGDPGTGQAGSGGDAGTPSAGSTTTPGSSDTTAPSGDTTGGTGTTGTGTTGTDTSGTDTTGTGTTGTGSAGTGGTDGTGLPATGGDGQKPAGDVTQVPSDLTSVVGQFIGNAILPVLPTPTGTPATLESAQRFFGPADAAAKPRTGHHEAAKATKSTKSGKSTKHDKAAGKSAKSAKAHGKHSSGKVSTGSVRKAYPKGKHSTGEYPEGKHAAIDRTHGSTEDLVLLTILGVINKPTE
ncbi:hypothetical protein GCM10009804_20070 [Kribbella hippodromi]|uniref:DUF5667 domain-containing protein n=1 Tax=Kribbella hippodromi TaxID=434347 RepID=A0ABN2CW41_9ACTN